MDGAEAGYRNPAIAAVAMSQCVGRREHCCEAQCVSLCGTVFSADLGGSSKYSNENFED